jgi:hypothetical protein
VSSNRIGIFNFLLSFFNLKKDIKSNAIRVPVVGELWVLSDGSPWQTKYPPVTILDVKDGWVRYDMNKIFRDERMLMKIFISCYEPYNGQ